MLEGLTFKKIIKKNHKKAIEMYIEMNDVIVVIVCVT